MLQKQCKPSKKVMDFVKETWDTEVSTCFLRASAKLAPDGVAHKQDVVILKTVPPQVCEVWLFAEVNSEVFALVSFWTLVKQDVAFSSIWNKVDDPKMIPLEEIKCSLPFKKLKDNQFVVILPFHCRRRLELTKICMAFCIAESWMLFFDYPSICEIIKKIQLLNILHPKDLDLVVLMIQSIQGALNSEI